MVAADADVLYGGTTRALLIYLDYHGLIRLHWSPLLITEMSRALVKTGRLTREAAALNTALMQRAVPGAEVPTRDVQAAFRRAWPGVHDAKDLHVAACAVALVATSTASTVHLVTKNTKDFAPRKLAALNVLQRHPDVFLLALWNARAPDMAIAFTAFRNDLPGAPSAERVLRKLAADGQRRTADAMADAHATGRIPL